MDNELKRRKLPKRFIDLDKDPASVPPEMKQVTVPKEPKMSKSKKFSDSGIGRVLWGIGDAITGKNAVGKALNQVLPFKQVRGVIGSVIKGIADVSPIPQISDAENESKVTRAIHALSTMKTKETEAVSVITRALDILDDGKQNGSVHISNDLRKKIRIGTSISICAFVLYELIGTHFGAPDLLPYITTALHLFGQ